MSQTKPERVATGLLEGISKKLWNLEANLMEDIVDQHGASASVAWFARNMPTYEKILKRWGPLRTHYLAVAISATNGCAYCTYGHAYSFVLHHFDQTGELFPLTEGEMSDLGQLDPAEVAMTLEDALITADMAQEVPWLHRTLARLEVPPTAAEQDDRWIDHLVQMFGWLNACGIAADTEPDAAHDPVNKNIELRNSYADARAVV